MAYVTLLNCVRVTALQDVEGMLRISFTTHRAGIVILIAKIQGIAYLILLELEQSWLVNNRMDIDTSSMDLHLEMVLVLTY